MHCGLLYLALRLSVCPSVRLSVTRPKFRLDNMSLDRISDWIAWWTHDGNCQSQFLSEINKSCHWQVCSLQRQVAFLAIAFEMPSLVGIAGMLVWRRCTSIFFGRYYKTNYTKNSDWSFFVAFETSECNFWEMGVGSMLELWKHYVFRCLYKVCYFVRNTWLHWHNTMRDMTSYISPQTMPALVQFSYVLSIIGLTVLKWP